jgi:hypothetical protein
VHIGVHLQKQHRLRALVVDRKAVVGVVQWLEQSVWVSAHRKEKLSIGWSAGCFAWDRIGAGCCTLCNEGEWVSGCCRDASNLMPDGFFTLVKLSSQHGVDLFEWLLSSA